MLTLTQWVTQWLSEWLSSLLERLVTLTTWRPPNAYLSMKRGMGCSTARTGLMKRLSFHTLLLPNASLLLDLDHILTPCTCEYYTSEGCQVEGFNFSGYDPNHCLPFYLWCSPSYPYTCDELAGKTATGKTIDPQMCSNQTFWEKKSCNSERYWRCTGDTPGQCKYDVEGNFFYQLFITMTKWKHQVEV